MGHQSPVNQPLLVLLLPILLPVICWSHPIRNTGPPDHLSTGSLLSSPADENLTVFASEKYPSLSRWASHAYEYVKRFSCHEILFMTRKNCQQLQSRSPDSMALYTAEPRDIKYKVTRTDGSDFKYPIHDAVLVIDPFPERKSSHLVMVFFVDLNVDRVHCEFRNGQFLGRGECLTLGLHRGCNNVWNQVSSPRKRLKYARRCENKHLPIVQPLTPDAGSNVRTSMQQQPSATALKSETTDVVVSTAVPDLIVTTERRSNELRCSDDVTGFASCSSLIHRQSSSVQHQIPDAIVSSRPLVPNRASSSSGSASDDCDPLQTNGTPWRCIRSRTSSPSDEDD